MARRRGSAAAVYWRGMIERQAASGLSIWRFCDRAGVSTASFYSWRRKLKQRPHEPRPLTGQTQVIGPLVPVQLIADAPGAGIAIELPGGVVVRLSATSDPASALCAATLVRALLRQGDGAC